MCEEMKALKYTALALTSLVVGYAGTYFMVMAEGDSYDPQTGEREYRSYCRLAGLERVEGDLSIFVSPTNWTNRLYYPMDLLVGRPAHNRPAP